MTLASIFGAWRAQGLNPLARLPSAARFPSTLNCYTGVQVIEFLFEP